MKNGTPHSRYFSDELGVPNFLINTEQMFAIQRNIWYNINMEKDIFTIKENTLSYGRGYVYSLQYHLVWCTKYRKQVLKNGLGQKTEYTNPPYAGYFPEGSFLPDWGVCRELGRTFRNRKYTEAL